MTQPVRMAVRDRQHWHALRNKHIGASEVSALFDCSPYMSKFELWHEKRSAINGKPLPPSDDNERTFLGRELEAAIGKAAAKKYKWRLVSCANQYYIHPSIAGMGCTPDFMIQTDEHATLGCLEIKNIDYLQFAKEWVGEEPPIYYILQLQQQMLCTGLSYGYIVALVGGNDLRSYYYELNDQTAKRIASAVWQFWQDIANGNEPKITSSTDLGVVKQMIDPRDDLADMTDNNYLPDLCARFLQARECRLKAEKSEKMLQAELLNIVGNHTFTLANGYEISYKQFTAFQQQREAEERSYYKLNVKDNTHG